MTKFVHSALLAASAVAAALVAVPASAQVNGIATVQSTAAIVSSQALQAGYQTIATQYQAQRATIDQRTQARQDLLRPFDTNGDSQIDDAESAPLQTPNNPTVAQLQALDAELQQLQLPINLARIYVVQQVAEQYPAALQQVISDRSVQIVIAPEALVFAPGADITEQVVNTLNSRLPSVSVTPPTGWQPTEQLVNLFQEVQNLLILAQAQQQQAAAAAAPPPATSGR